MVAIMRLRQLFYNLFVPLGALQRANWDVALRFIANKKMFWAGQKLLVAGARISQNFWGICGRYDSKNQSIVSNSGV
jgi:hypothetical protein